MYSWRNLSSGFTIVELLVVIVVIAILVAVTTVGYTNIQRGAFNAQTATAIRQYKTALMLYESDHGEYPRLNSATGPWGANCLGEDYSMSDNKCWTSNTPGIANTPKIVILIVKLNHILTVISLCQRQDLFCMGASIIMEQFSTIILLRS